MDVPEPVIIGANSFIGRHLATAYRKIWPGLTTTTRRASDVSLPGNAFLDLEKPDLDGVLRPGVGVAIIAAANSRVIPCEEDPEGTRRANVAGMLQLIEQLHDRKVLPVFMSTDYVFDGTTREGYADDAPLCPCTEYGRQKAEVETALAKSGRPHVVLRLSKIYGLVRGDGSLLDEIATRLLSGEDYAAASDQVFCPSCVHDLAPGILELLKRGLRGPFNFCASQPWSRYEIARAVARHLGVPEERVSKVSLDDLPGNFRRPKCTTLRPERMAREANLRFMQLQDALPKLHRVNQAS